MVGGVKATFIALLAFSLCLSAVGADKKPLTKEQSAKVIEAAIRKAAQKPTGELTKADLEKVRKLSLFNNQLTDVTPLKGLTKLTRLSLSNNQLTDVTGLEKLTQLTWLSLSKNNKLTDVKSLDNLTKLETLYLNYNQLTEVPEGLEKLTQLTWLDLSNNPDLTKAQIDELKKALPNCTIRSNPTK